MADYREQSTDAAVKAGSAAAAASDASLVVALSPNSSIPLGSNTIGGVRIVDGGGTYAAIKGANTPAVGSDPALVVTVSPNSLSRISDVLVGYSNGTLSTASTAGALLTPTAGGFAATAAIVGSYLDGSATANISVVGGSWTGSIFFDVSVDGTNWLTVPVINVGTLVESGSIAANGFYQAPLAGILSSRVRMGSGAVITTSPTIALQLSGKTCTIKEHGINLSGTQITAKAVPAGGSGQSAIPVYTNAVQMRTYTSACRAVATGALTANTAKPIFAFQKTAAATTVKIRRIIVSGYATSALAGQLDFQLNRGTAAGTGTAATVNGAPRVTGDAATICTMLSLPTIVAATVVDVIPGFVVPTTTATGFPFTVLHDWQEAGETKPWTLVAGSIDALVINAISAAALNFNLSCHIVYTEE